VKKNKERKKFAAFGKMVVHFSIEFRVSKSQREKIEHGLGRRRRHVKTKN
jgi:hypothetical protein